MQLYFALKSLFSISRFYKNFKIMALPNIFSLEIVTKLESRINILDAESKLLWGKMNAPQMLAHCTVPYEMVYSDKVTSTLSPMP
jgi:hypothetical protein